MFDGVKIILVQPGVAGDYDCEYGTADITVCEDIKDAMPKLIPSMWGNFGVMELLLNDEHFCAELERRGWINTQKAKRVAANVVDGQRFWLWDLPASRGWSAVPRPIDLENVNSLEIDELAKDQTVLLREVRKTTLRKTHNKAYRQMLAARKRQAMEALKRFAAAEKRKKTLRQKEIEKAKKVLKDAGEKVK